VIDETTTAILTGAAGNIVAHMLSNRLDSLRAWVSRLLRGEPEDAHRAILQKIDDDVLALNAGRVSAVDVSSRWGVLLATLLTGNPALRAELVEMATKPETSLVVNLGTQRNSGEGTFIAGNNYGGLR
jgi:hypothetical protein